MRHQPRPHPSRLRPPALPTSTRPHPLQIFSANVNTCGTSTVPLPLGLGTVTINALACPTTAGGSAGITVSVTLPAIAPSGAYDVKLTANDQAGAAAYCVDAQFNL